MDVEVILENSKYPKHASTQILNYLVISFSITFTSSIYTCQIAKPFYSSEETDVLKRAISGEANLEQPFNCHVKKYIGYKNILVSRSKLI